MVALWFVTFWPVKVLAQGESGLPDKILVGTLAAPPFVMKTASGRWEGLSIELWHAVAQDLEVEYEVREYTSHGQILDAKVDAALARGNKEFLIATR